MIVSRVARRRSGPWRRIAAPLPGVVAVGLVLAACTGSLDIDPSTIGGAEPDDLIGGDVEQREAPTLTLPSPSDDTVARPEDLDELAAEAQDPWYLADGPTREAVGATVAARLAELDTEGVCAYLAQELDGPVQARLAVPSADTAYPTQDPRAARRLTERAALDVLDQELGVRDLRVASSVTDACLLAVDPDRARVAARGVLARALDLPGAQLRDPIDEGWAASLDPDDEGVPPGVGTPAAGPRDAQIVAAWASRLETRASPLCAWVTAPPRPTTLDDVLARLVQVRAGSAHDGLPAATDALIPSCPALAALRWAAADGADADDPPRDADDLPRDADDLSRDADDPPSDAEE
ncbi:MAG: hypothetical protein JJT89_11215 [Nitriliruptoraceae bacterium]|nr:hypothetical protein [Nitriliruptoraceae bacterium]